MKNPAFCLTVVIALTTLHHDGFSQSDQCGDALNVALMSRWEINSYQDLDIQIMKVLMLERQEVEQIVRTNDTSFGISIPVAKAFLSSAFGSSSTASDIRELKEKLVVDDQYKVSKEEIYSVKTWIAPVEALKFWSECMMNMKGLKIGHTGSLESRFTIFVSWKRGNASDPPEVKILDIAYESVDRKEIQLDKGDTLKEFNSYSQKFYRTDSAAGFVSVAVDGYGREVLPLPSIERPQKHARPEYIEKEDIKEVISRDGWTSTPFVPKHAGGGDTDFDGNGPEIYARASLAISDDRRKVFLKLYMKAQETKSNHTRAEETSQFENRFVVYEAPDNYVVEQINSPLEDVYSYIDRNHDVDTRIPVLHIPLSKRYQSGQFVSFGKLFSLPASTNNGLVKQWEFVGDTDGPESGTRTSVRVTLHPVKILIKGKTIIKLSELN